MCNEAARRIALDQLREDWSQTGIELRFPEGQPNMAPLDGFRITDRTTIIRASAQAAGADLVTRRWSWPGSHGKPVYNFRSEGFGGEGRDLKSGRCLIPVDEFYEFTAPADPKQKRKDKWAFRLAEHDWFCIAGLWRDTADVGDAFTMLTCPPGPDLAPYHSRQVVVLGRGDWARWLDPTVPSAELCRPLPAGSLTVRAVS